MKKAFISLNYLHRVQDNPLFIFAAQEKLEIIPFIFLPQENLAKLGAAEKLWLHHSIDELNKNLGSRLVIFKDLDELNKLIKEEKPNYLLYSSNSDTRVNVDFDKLAKNLAGIELKDIRAHSLFDFDQIRNKTNGVYKVYTPFYKYCLTQTKEYIADALKSQLSNDILKHIKFANYKNSTKLESLELLGTKAKWNKAWQSKMLEHWSISEKATKEILENFGENHVFDYPEARDIPSQSGTSKLSCYLHFGMISPFRAWYEIEQKKLEDKNKKSSIINKDIKDSNGYDAYLRQLIWREFAQYILFHFPHSKNKNLNSKFDNFPWKKSKKFLDSWKTGQTGYPIVDAGMRELWETGWMHNRVRMIVGSFLVKDLMLHWLDGAKWFEETLFDADLANNSMGWQWVAGSGVDASPYFRIFNPMTQSEKFDKAADYIRKWVPELSNLDNKWIHKPFEAPELILKAADIELGKDYPKPIVNHKAARDEALEAFKSL